MTTENTPFILPRVPSQLIRLSIEDLEKAEKVPTVRIHMGSWHIPHTIENDTHSVSFCAMCLAGTVMRGHLGATDTEQAFPNDYPENQDQLNALDDFRQGDCENAFTILGHSPEDGYKFNKIIPRYMDDSEKFKSEMRKLADELEAAGF